MANSLEEKEQIDSPPITLSEVALIEATAAAGLEAIYDGIQRLLYSMDTNLSLLEDSVREVRTARQIAAESNRVARRLLREGNLALGVATK